MKFGRLTAECLGNPPRTRSGDIRWKCVCDCGKSSTVTARNLKKGATISCGCAKRKLTDEEVFWKRVISDCKQNASRRELSFSLTDKQVKDLVLSNCFYCGSPPTQRKIPRGVRGGGCTNGIDRVDNAVGYEPENCVPCCKICNRAKREISEREFNEWIVNMIKHQTERGIHGQ